MGQRYAYVLDDEQKVGTIVCHGLTTYGFVARQFDSVVPFVVETKKSAPELVVLDLALGESDAVEVMRQLETLAYPGKVLLISGRDETTLYQIKEIGKSRGLAMLPPLQKPFRLNELRRSIEAAPESRKVERPDTSGAAAIPPIDLGEALRNRRLELWYQPKIDLKTLTVCGAEALLRARHPQYGLIPPVQFLPPAGDPLYHPLTTFVVQQALVDWNTLAEHQPSMKLAVNIPLSVIQAADFIRSIREALPKAPTFPGFIIEITEDEVTHNPESIQEIAAQLKLYNVWLSIDDFGAGFSSLARLRDLPCAEIKLDRSFVTGCSLDSGKQSLCNAAVDLAHAFGASLCAEGVETMQDLRTLLDMRCDVAQGYLFAKPMPFQAFLESMSRSSAAIAGGSPSGTTRAPEEPQRRSA